MGAGQWMVAGLAGLFVTAPGADEVPALAASSANPTIVIRHDTPVELMATAEVSTATATAGTVFKMRVNRAITLDGKTIIPVGTPAFGEVTAATESASLGESGTMAARLVRIQFGDVAIPIEGKVDAEGAGAGSVAMAVLTSGLMGLFHRGNNAKIKAGEILSGFVSEDVTIDLLPTPHRAVPIAAPAR